MNYYANAKQTCPEAPHVHPLLLSLTEAYSESESAPNISSVSEDDPRALRSNHYTSPSDLPPLDIHFRGKNGASPSVKLMNLSSHQQGAAESAWHLSLKKNWQR
jgi:hypothetical protein